MNQPDTMPVAAAPGPFSWLTAVCSFLGVAMVLYFGMLASAGYQIASTQAELAQALNGAKRPEQLLVDSRFKKLFAAKENQAQQAFRVLSFVSEGDLEKGLKTLEGKEIGTLPGKVDLRSKLSAIIDSRSGASGTTETQDALVTKTRRNRALYGLLVRELRGILLGEAPPQAGTAPENSAGAESHPPQEESMAELLSEPPYYTSGVLAGFPVLPSIPDGVEDSKALVQYLPPDVRALLVNVSSKQQSTNKRLEDLKARSAELRAESQDILKKLTAIVDERAQLKRTEKKNLAELQASSAAMVRQLALTRVEEKVEGSYNLLLNLLSRFEIRLPPLMLSRA